MSFFKLISHMEPKGDQPQAIEKLVAGFLAGKKEQVLMDHVEVDYLMEFMEELKAANQRVDI